MIICDRCHGVKHDASIDTNDAVSYGCYDVSVGYWSQFSHESEKVVCDECMWKDPRYVAVYGRH